MPGWRHSPTNVRSWCRYVARPAVSEQRLALTKDGRVRYELKTPYSNGTTHVIFEPLDFIARLAALFPKPRVNMTRFHGVFVRGSHPPNSNYRVTITPAKRGKGAKPKRESLDNDATGISPKLVTHTTAALHEPT